MSQQIRETMNAMSTPASISDAVMTEPILWTQHQTATYLGVSEKWLERDRWVGATIPFVKVGRSVRYRAGDVVAYLNANTTVAA